MDPELSLLGIYPKRTIMGAQTDCGVALFNKILDLQVKIPLDPFGVCPSPQAEATLLRQPQPRTEQGARVRPISLLLGTSLLGHYVPEVPVGLAET